MEVIFRCHDPHREEPHIVNLLHPSCSCRSFTNTRFPCRHMIEIITKGLAKWEDFPLAFRENPFFIKEDLRLLGISSWPTFVENDFPPPSDDEDEDASEIVAQPPLVDRRGNINALAEGMKGLSRDSRFDILSPEVFEEKSRECFYLLAPKLGTRSNLMDLKVMETALKNSGKYQITIHY